MTDLTPYYAALQKADAAGDSDGAKQLADFIRSQPANAPLPRMIAVHGQAVAADSPEGQAAQSPVSDSTTQNALAGAGKAFVDTARGAGQLVGAVSNQDVADSRARDAPLMATTAGKVGNLAGNIAITAPMLAIPGANTLAGAALIGAGSGALQPHTSAGEQLLNTGIGTLAGAAGQAVGQRLAKGATTSLADRAAAAQAEQSTNAARDSVLTEAKNAGYVVPPTAVNPSATATALESVSGKAATRQVAQAKNQTVTNGLVASDLGIPANTPITKQALADVRAKAGPVYQAVKSTGTIQSDAQYAADLAKVRNVGANLQQAYPGIGAQASSQINDLVDAANVATHNASDAVDLTKLLRNQSKANYRSAFAAAGDPEKLALAKAQSQVANAVEDQVGRHLASIGQPDLAKQWSDARTLIAKSYQAEGALKGNDVSAIKLAAQIQKGKPVSGGMGTAARFADQFGDVAKLPKSGAGVSKLSAALIGEGLLGGAALHSPSLAAGSLAAAAVPYVVRKGILSKVGQSALATPDYTPGALGTLFLKGAQNLPRIATPLSVDTALAQTQ